MTRTPDEVLAELGEQLRRAPMPRRPRRRRLLRGALLTAALCAVGVPASVAMRPNAADDPTRPAGARAPDAVSPPLLLTRGDEFTLTATRCRFGSRLTVALTVRVAGGLAGRRCEALTPAARSGPALPPVSYVDLARARSLVFGAVPAATARVQLLLAGRRPRTIAARRSAGVTFFVVSLDPGERLLGTLGEAADGTPTIRCDEEHCA